MKYLWLLGFAVAGLVQNPAFASAELADKRNCISCHAVGKKMVGPAYKDIAAKYAGQPDAEAMLVQRVMKGSSGVWGLRIAMPANTQVSQAEAQALVKWILTLK